MEPEADAGDSDARGQVTGSVVQRIDWAGATGLSKAAFQGVDPSSASLKVTGEALALEVAPGRWLFALLKGDKGWQGEPGLNASYAIAVPRGLHARSPEGVDAILWTPKDTPLPLLPEAWPMLVTFDDIALPETVRRVGPGNLAAVFGEGVRLEAVTLELTEGAVTEGRVEEVLGWLRPLWPNMLDGKRYQTLDAQNRFANPLSVGHFSSELGK